MLPPDVEPEPLLGELPRFGCKDGKHVWQWIGASAESEPPEDMPCACGLVRWRRRKYASAGVWADERER